MIRYNAPQYGLIMLAIGSLLGGCAAVNSNQVGTVQRLLPERDPLLAQAAPFAWELRFAGAAYTAYPATPGGGRIIFGTPDGLRAYWDGRVL
jgi:hypothetical protein